MPDPGFTRPDLCSIPAADGEAEPAEQSAAGSAPTATRRPAMTRPHPRRAAPTAPSACPPWRPCSPWRASRLMSPTATPTRSSGPTARPGSPPGSACHDRRPGLRQFDGGGAVRGAAPGAGPLPGPLAARAGHRRTLTANMAQGWSHGPVGTVIAAWRSAWWARTNFWSGSSAPPGRQTAGRQPGTCALVRPTVLRHVLSRPQPPTASASEGAGATRQT